MDADQEVGFNSQSGEVGEWPALEIYRGDL